MERSSFLSSRVRDDGYSYAAPSRCSRHTDGLDKSHKFANLPQSFPNLEARACTVHTHSARVFHAPSGPEILFTVSDENPPT